MHTLINKVFSEPRYYLYGVLIVIAAFILLFPMVHWIVRRCRGGSAYRRIRRGRPAGHARHRPLLRFI